MILQKMAKKKKFQLDCRQKRREGFQAMVLHKTMNDREAEFCVVFRWFVVYVDREKLQTTDYYNEIQNSYYI